MGHWQRMVMVCNYLWYNHRNSYSIVCTYTYINAYKLQALERAGILHGGVDDQSH